VGEVGRLSRSLQLRVSGPGAGAHPFALSKFYRRAGKNEPVPIEIKPVAALTDKPPIPKRSPAGESQSVPCLSARARSSIRPDHLS